MRLLIASMAALAAVSFAAPSFAQDETMPTPTPTAKPKAPTTASCNKIKSSSQRSACLKKVQVAKAPSKKTKKTTTTPAAPKSPEMGQLPPASAPAPTAAAPSSGPVSVPPLPSKTI
ncbi:MAG: hypothetical protein EPO10_28965 [Reyranella sp.]|uniref:hypothetical protein n=1 Tax=Reyranella sp. TaxID=1929291 RepID=UPI00121BFDF6|nr:hypothetical protein [Reyranella sp.]TAJ96232.1 MAG: hypothetical protein EPO41_07115 [Reyranella sp.]TBR21979.1 MAG: hypothetical protein EPO10_28965 [Reyranella sp.]